MGDYLTIDGVAAFKGVLGIPRVGNWHIDCAIDNTNQIEVGSHVAILLGNDDAEQLSFAGTVKRGDTYLDTQILRVVGGGGDLATVLEARSFRLASSRTILQTILGKVGDKLSPLCDQQVLAKQFQHWSIPQQSVGAALRTLIAEFAGVVWRVLPDGTFWVGSETWPQTRLGDFELLGDDPRLDSRTIFADTPALFPGELAALDVDADLPPGRQVSKVEHRIAPAKIQTEVWYEIDA